MSLQFSDPVNGTGIIELIDDLVDTNDAIYPKAKKTRDANMALDWVLALIFQVGGTWNFDDSNHSDYPIITTDLIEGQRDYTFVTDENSNLILEVQKVMISDETGLFREITPVDVSSGYAPTGFDDGLNVKGQPNTYDKNATGIFLDPIPNYSKANGLKVYISREGSYFSPTDTTKKPGFAGLFHEYLALRPAYQYASRKDLPKAARLKAEMLEMEDAIREHYKRREKDVRKRLTTKTNCAR